MRKALLAAPALLLAGAAVLLSAAPASAHVAPSTTIELDVHERDITASLTLPTEDLATATGLDLGTLDAATTAELVAYLEQHFAVTSDAATWTVSVDDLGTRAAEQWGTGAFDAITATATLTPSDPDAVRALTLHYDAIIHQVATADISVILHRDWATGALDSARELGTISLDTVTGTIPTLAIDLDAGSAWQGFVGMVALGVSHIAEGTDHQLFLLTLLLPAPLLAVGRRWRGTVTTRTAIRRITTITLAFTLGHSATLALGAFGLPVPQQPIEVLIALSILVAAVHAWRPLFPGKEAVVAGLFGLVHGMAFSTTLSELDLSGGQLVLSLLGFNVGIELMQLAVVALVLPALLMLARTRAYAPLRTAAASLTALAAVGWALERVGVSTPLAAVGNSIGAVSPWLLAAMWAAAAILVARQSTTASDWRSP